MPQWEISYNHRWGNWRNPRKRILEGENPKEAWEKYLKSIGRIGIDRYENFIFIEAKEVILHP